MEKVKQVEFRITVKMLEDDSVRVEISDAYSQEHKVDAPFEFWMTACEYLLHKTAQKSSAGYEKAVELLNKGAMTYRNVK